MDKKKLFNVTVSTALVISMSFNGYLGYRVYTLGEKLEVIQAENISLGEKVEILEGEKSDLTEKVEELEAKKITLSERIEQLEKDTYIDGAGILEGTNSPNASADGTNSGGTTSISPDGLIGYNPIVTPEDTEQAPPTSSSGGNTQTPSQPPKQDPTQKPPQTQTPPQSSNNTNSSQSQADKLKELDALLNSIDKGPSGTDGSVTTDGNGQDLSDQQTQNTYS